MSQIGSWTRRIGVNIQTYLKPPPSFVQIQPNIGAKQNDPMSTGSIAYRVQLFWGQHLSLGGSLSEKSWSYPTSAQKKKSAWLGEVLKTLKHHQEKTTLKTKNCNNTKKRYKGTPPKKSPPTFHFLKVQQPKKKKKNQTSNFNSKWPSIAASNQLSSGCATCSTSSTTRSPLVSWPPPRSSAPTEWKASVVGRSSSPPISWAWKHKLG